VIENLRVSLRSEIVVLFTPYSPAVCHTVGNLFNGCFSSGGTIWLRYSCFTEIFLSKDICSNLAPLFWNFHVIHFKNNLTIRVSDYRSFVIIFKLIKYVDTLGGKLTAET